MVRPNNYLSMTTPAASRSPSSTSTSDRGASMDPEEESADDSDFLEADLADETADSSFTVLVPALATPKHNLSITPWPYTSQAQTSPSIHSSTSLAFTLTNGSEKTGPPVIPASSLPHEILLHILRLLPAAALSPALLVCKSWCQCGVELLWHKPSFPNLTSLYRMLVVLSSPEEEQTFPYLTFIRRLNLSALQEEMDDKTLRMLASCERLERLTLAGCARLTSDALVHMLSSCKQLVAVDLSDVPGVSDEAVEAIANNCPRLQGLNLSGCKKVTNRGVEAIAKGCQGLRRIKLRHVHLLTDPPIILLSIHCPVLLEVDLISCPGITSLALLQLFRTSNHLRELSLQACFKISDAAFPSTSSYIEAADETMSDSTTEVLAESDGTLIERPLPLTAAPSLRSFDHLRYLDLTSLTLVTDAAIAGIVAYMPRIRNLILAKCTGLTDDAILSICGLGKHLHYLHLGHVSAITDRAVTRLARSCTRLRYIDLACCHLLTDMSVFELATNLPRLKRIGLVRVANLTDEAIYALFARTSLERIHLSYCDNLSVQSIHELLAHLPRLTHLSLTGVTSFRRPDLQTWCRQPPREFNSHQRASFCVYSGKGVTDLRRYLRSINMDVPSPDANEAGGPRTRATANRQAAQIQAIPPHNPNGRAAAAPAAGARRQPHGFTITNAHIVPPAVAATVRGANTIPRGGAVAQIPAFRVSVPIAYVQPPTTNGSTAMEVGGTSQEMEAGGSGGRARAGTVTRGNFLEDARMEHGSEGSSAEEEEDVEMN